MHFVLFAVRDNPVLDRTGCNPSDVIRTISAQACRLIISINPVLQNGGVVERRGHLPAKESVMRGYAIGLNNEKCKIKFDHSFSSIVPPRSPNSKGVQR